MEQEYPETEIEALTPSKALAAFDLKVLTEMEDNLREPLEVIDGVINIYQKWRLGTKYLAGSDVSHGVGKDYSATVILDARTGLVVADILDNTIEPEDFAWASIRMLGMYKNLLWGIEDNEWGITVVNAARRSDFPDRMIYQRETGRGKDYYGWHTDGKTRWELWGDLRVAINQARQIVITNRSGLAQFASVILNPEKGGRPEALEGENDDYPTAVGIAWQMRKEIWIGGTPRDLAPITYW